jgi:hypothetical protein
MRLELSLDISDGQNGTFSMEELHALAGHGPFPPRRHDMQEAFRDGKVLREEAGRLSSVLRACGARFFSGDPRLWVDLQAERQHRFEAEEDSRAIACSEDAFRTERWQDVVSLLGPRAARISKAAALRLAVARKRLGAA